MASAEPAVRGRAYRESLRGRQVVVVGLARSGIAAVRLLAACGAHVTATDAKSATALGPEAGALASLGVRLEQGHQDVPALASADLVVVSPGVPLDAPVLATVRAPIIGELELGWRAAESEAVAITGTNGKTTTTALCGELLTTLGRPVLVGGNIGTPLTAHALDFPARGLLVLEVSSFQLETIHAFRPGVAAVLNVTPDHLDRHHTMEKYVAAKARIFENQAAADRAVLNWDDPMARAMASRTRTPIVWFSRREALPEGVFVDDGRIVARLDGALREICPVVKIALRGAHNVENVLAATAIALLRGVPPEAIRSAIGRFRAVAHRIELVRELAGVAYYNDSKGTNVDSTIRALESFPEPVILIAGGQGKGQDWAPLAAAAQGRVRHAVLIGADGPQIGAALAGVGIATSAKPTLEAAVASARAIAERGDVVLLSPACASYDMFRNFEHRGEVFTAIVRGLAER
jgi:UDP-N-acetylmuramoylalanine--D-glutamate ligase